MSIIVATYLIYLALSVGLTVWVARTLFRGGRAFLIDVFHGQEAIADSVNRLLVVGFYLVNLGYVTLQMRMTLPVTTTQEAIEALSVKIGLVLLVLGAMHFGNLFVFSRWRRRALTPDYGPVDPEEYLPPDACEPAGARTD